MGEFLRKFMQLNGKLATIILDHCWFGIQQFEVARVSIIEDVERLGVVLHGQDKFVYKNKLRFMDMQDGIIEFADDKLKISIKF